jgi:hypothetical protein
MEHVAPVDWPLEVFLFVGRCFATSGHFWDVELVSSVLRGLLNALDERSDTY